MTRSSGRWTSAAANSAAIALVVMTVACGTSAPAGPVTHERHTIGRGAATRARVEIDMSAGELVVKSGATKLLEGDYDFNVPALKPMIAYAVNGNAGTLKLSQGSASGNYENTWHLSLDETIPIDLAVSVTAGDAELVLGRVNLQNVSIRLGAGDLVVDLRGTPARSYTVMVQAGAGDTTIRLPASVGISAGTSGLIGDSNVSGLEQRDGKWINPRAQGSPVVVDVTVQHAIGDLTLIAE
jgi:hypothetical protein